MYIYQNENDLMQASSCTNPNTDSMLSHVTILPVMPVLPAVRRVSSVNQQTSPLDYSHDRLYAWYVIDDLEFYPSQIWVSPPSTPSPPPKKNIWSNVVIQNTTHLNYQYRLQVLL